MIFVQQVFAAQTQISLIPTVINGNVVTSENIVCDNQKNPYEFVIAPDTDMTLHGATVTLSGDWQLITHLHATIVLPGTTAKLDFGYHAVTSDTVSIPLPDIYIRRDVNTTITLTPVIPCSTEGTYSLSLSDLHTDATNHTSVVEEQHLTTITTSLRSSPYQLYNSDIRSVFFTDYNAVIKTCLDPLQITDTGVYPISILKAVNTDIGIVVDTIVDRKSIGAWCKDTTIPLLALGAGEAGVTHTMQFFLDRQSDNTAYEQTMEDNSETVNHLVQRAATDSSPAHLTWTPDIKTLWWIVGLSICNNDKTIVLPGATPTLAVTVENKVNKTTMQKDILLPKNFTIGSCSYAYMHRRELGTINEWTYRIIVSSDAWPLSDYIVTETENVNVTILNTEAEALAIRQDYKITNFFLKEDDITFSICNEWWKSIIERQPTIAVYRGHITDIANATHTRSRTITATMGSEECITQWLNLNDLPDSVFVGGNKQLTLAVIDSIDEYDFGNNLIRFEANKYEREGITTPIEQADLPYDPNLSTQQLIDWMYDNGLTKFKTIEDFGPDRLITRGEIAKFFTQFAAILDMKVIKSNELCKFSDIATYDETLVPHIIKACKLWLVNGFAGRYSPDDNLLEAEGLTVVIRALNGIQDETRNPRRLNYYTLAANQSIIDPVDPRALDQDATRETIGLRLYRAAYTAQIDMNAPTVDWR